VYDDDDDTVIIIIIIVVVVVGRGDLVISILAVDSALAHVIFRCVIVHVSIISIAAIQTI